MQKTIRMQEGSFIPEKNLNSHELIDLCTDKYKTDLFLRKNKILTPYTAIYTRSALTAAIKRCKSLILKPRYGEKGDGIIVIDSLKTARVGPYPDYLVQEKIESQGISGHVFDIRVFLQGDSTYVYSRMSKRGMIVCNIDKGGQAVPYRYFLSCMKGKRIVANENIMATTKRIRGLLEKFDFREAGIDFIVDMDGKAYVIEINSRPGIRGFFILAKNKLYRDALKNILKKRMEVLRCAE